MTDRLRFALLPFIFLFLLQGPVFCAEREVRPTFAKESSAQVPRGGEVQVALEAIPDYGNLITFQIQTGPQHGELSDLTPTSDHTAVVTYRHDGSKTPLTDGFLFRAQSPGRAKSSPTRVTLTVVPPPALLSIEPKELNFGSRLLGEKVRTNVIMKNLGGVRTEGRLLLPNGFSAPEGDAYSLEEGEQREMVLEFSPQEEKDYAVQADTLPSFNTPLLRLTGKGVACFDVKPKDPLSCVVTNLSDRPLRIAFEGDPVWTIPSETELPPRSAKEFSFQQVESEEDSSTDHSPRIQITDGNSTRFFELPPYQGFIPLTLLTNTPTDFGSSPVGKIFPVKFTLLNRSEMSKTIRWMATSAAGGGMTSEVPLILKGGEAKELHYDWQPALAGPAELKVRVNEGKQTTHELVWRAVLTAAPLQQSSSQTPFMPEHQEESAAAVPENRGSEMPLKGSPIPPLEGVAFKLFTTWTGKHNLEIRWKGKEEDLPKVKLEKRVMKANPLMDEKGQSGQSGPAMAKTPFVLDSLPLEASSSRRDGEFEVWEFRDFPSGWHLLFLSQYSKPGVLEAQSQMQVFVPPRESFFTLVKIPLLLAILLLSCLFLWWRR